MLQTDLSGMIDEMKTNKTCHLVLFVLIIVLLYWMANKYLPEKNKFINVYPAMLYGTNTGRCDSDIPKLDEVLIRNMIDLPNRNPKLLTSSMVYPAKQPSIEEQRKTRMDILNMFYSSFDDDVISIGKRPQGLYLTP